MPRKGGSTLRVGALVLVAVAAFVAAILLIGEQSKLFASKADYYVMFNNVGGLDTGNPVQLNGVDVGRVTEVLLPAEPGKNDIRVEISIEQRFAPRVRQDSQASIATLGLLGDKYIELTSGSMDVPTIPEGGQIPTAPTTSIDELLASGENLMDNVIAISFSLRNILGRMERGEGILGRLTVDTPEAEALIDSVKGTVAAAERIAEKVESGEGPIPRLINDPQMARRLDESLARLESVLAKLDEGEGALPRLLNDPTTAERLDTLLDLLNRVATDLASFVEEVESSDGLLQRLLTDEEYGEEVSREIRSLVDRIDDLSAEIAEGDGTVAQLIEDPQIYQALQDILVGIDESRILRWLIRNRQKKGIEVRYEEGVEAGEVPPLPAEKDFPEEDGERMRGDEDGRGGDGTEEGSGR